ncbi:S-layer homology domain-containing protein [Fusibacter bizertensis]
MKKVLSLVLAFVLVLGMIPTFAADAAATGALNLYDNGFITGKDGATVDAKLDVNAKLTRAELAALIAELYGEKEEAAAFAQPADFKDADTFQDWAKPYIAYAQENGWMNGLGDGTMFGPTQPVPANQLVAVLMNALGYEVTWNTVLADAAELGIIADGDSLTRGEAFEAMWVAVKDVPMNTEEGLTLGVKLGKLQPEVPVVTELKVESVTALNLKEVEVKFNQKVDLDTVVAANFTVKKGTTSVATTPELQADGMTVKLIASPIADGGLTNQADYTVTVDKVKSETGLVVAKVTEPFNAFDGTLPVLESVAYTGPKQVELTFSEPIKNVTPNTGKVVIKSGNSTLSVNLASASIKGWGTNVLQIPLYSSLVDGTTYSITVSEYKDFAGYQNVIKTVDLAYTKDVTPPTVSVVKATQEYVVVEFSKPVTGVNEDHFAHTFTAWNAVKVTADDSILSADATSGTKFYVWFNDAAAVGDLEKAKNRPIGEGTTTLIVLGKTTATEIKDLWSNKLADTNLPLSVTADKTAPEVKEIKVTAEDKFTVEFTKAVTFAKTNIEVLDKDGKAISGLSLSVAASSSKKYTVTMAGKDVSGMTLIVNIKGVKDTTLQTNAMAAYNTTIEITDKTAPKVVQVTHEVVGSGDSQVDNIYVFFNESVDSETALVAGNYQLLNGSTYTKLTNTPEFVNGTKTVKIQLTATELAAFHGIATNLFVDNVKDVAGNAIVEKVFAQIQPHDTAIKPLIAKYDADGNGTIEPGETTPNIQATGTRAIKVYFDQELAEIQSDAFTVSNSASYGMDVALVDGKTVVTLNLNTAIDDPQLIQDASNANVTVTLGADKVTNLFGVKNDVTAALGVMDKIAPAIAVDVNEDPIITETGVGEITIEFTENLDNTGSLPDLYAQDLVVIKGTTTLTPGTGYQTAVSGKNLIISGLATGDYKISTKDTITYLKDMNGNKAVKFTDVTELNAVATAPVAGTPVITAAVADHWGQTLGDKIVITFNEAIDPATLNIAGIAANGNTSAALVDPNTEIFAAGKLGIFATPAAGANVATVAATVNLDATGKIVTVTVTTAGAAVNSPTGAFTQGAAITDVLGN